MTGFNDELAAKFELLNSKFLFNSDGLYTKAGDDYYKSLVSRDETVDGLCLGALEWHNGTDFVYAFTSTAYNSNHGCCLWVVIEAYEMFKVHLASIKASYEAAEAVFISENGKEFFDSYFDDVDFEASIYDQFDWEDDEIGGQRFLEITQNYYHLASVVDVLTNNLNVLGVSYDILQDALTEGFEPSSD